MQKTELLAGKSVTLSFRAPLDLAAEIVARSRRTGQSVSALTFRLWQNELGKEGTSNGGTKGKQ